MQILQTFYKTLETKFLQLSVIKTLQMPFRVIISVANIREETSAVWLGIREASVYRVKDQ
jgi:hypothetical protein